MSPGKEHPLKRTTVVFLSASPAVKRISISHPSLTGAVDFLCSPESVQGV